MMNAGLGRVGERSERPARNKRLRYVANAWRRKLKCDGSIPCHRCMTQSVTCTYSHQSRHRDTTTGITHTEMNTQQVSNEASTPDTRDEGAFSRYSGPLSPGDLLQPSSQASSTPKTPTPAGFCGPSSSEFTLNVVNGNLEAMGISAVIGDASTPLPESRVNSSFHSAQRGPFMEMLTTDPLWDLDQDDALRLISDYCRGPGSLYPVVDHQHMLTTATNVFRLLELARSGRQKDRGVSAAEAVFNDETNKLKAIIAIGRTLESGGRNEQAQRLFQSITKAVEGLLWNLDGINGIQLLVLVALYLYHLDDEPRTGRIVGFAARICLEMGLHRREMVVKTFPEAHDQVVALKVFWSIYILERRVSLGLGIPFSIQDTHVDPSLLTLHPFHPFMRIMLDWTRLAGKTWQALNDQGEKGGTIAKDDIDYLDYLIVQWYKNIPSSLQLQGSGPNTERMTIEEGQDPMYLPAILFLRQYHLRNLIYRPILQSSVKIMQMNGYGSIGVQVAKESIKTLFNLNQSTRLIRNHPIFFKHLLLTAFGNLLLAVVNATSEFWDDVRGEFHMALRLIRLLSTRSVPLMRLWHRLKGLEELQAKIVCSTVQDPDKIRTQQPAPDSTIAMDFSSDLVPTFPVISGVSKTGSSPEYTIGGQQMRDEFASLFDNSMGSDCIFDFPFGEIERMN